MDGDSPEAHSPARAREWSHGPPQTPTEAQEATPTSSAFGVAQASLPEDTPPDRRGVIFSNTSVLQLLETGPLKVLQTIANSLSPIVDTPQIKGVWQEGVPHPSEWKPNKRITLEDLDQVFKETQEPTARAQEETSAEVQTESSDGNPTGTSLVSGYPAGFEYELDSNLDELELQAPSDQLSDFDDEEVEDRFCRPRSTRPCSSYLSDKIARDKSERINKKEKERNESTAQSSTLSATTWLPYSQFSKKR